MSSTTKLEVLPAKTTNEPTQNGLVTSLLLESLGGPVIEVNDRVDLLRKQGAASVDQVVALLTSHIGYWKQGGKPHDAIPILTKMLGQLGGDIARELLLELAGPKYAATGISYHATNALAELADPAIVPRVIQIMYYPSTSNRTGLAQAIRYIPEARDLLVAELPAESEHNALDAHRPARAVWIIDALMVRGDWDNATTQRMLDVAQYYPNDAVRSEAYSAIGAALPRSMKPEAAPELVARIIAAIKESAVSDGSDQVRAVAVNVKTKLLAWSVQ